MLIVIGNHDLDLRASPIFKAISINSLAAMTDSPQCIAREGVEKKKKSIIFLKIFKLLDRMLVLLQNYHVYALDIILVFLG